MSTTAKKGHQISGSGGASTCDLCFASVYSPPLHSKLADRKTFALLSLPLQLHFCCSSSSQWSSPLSSSLSSRYVAAPVKCVLFACFVAVYDPPLHTRAGRQTLLPLLCGDDEADAAGGSGGEATTTTPATTTMTATRTTTTTAPPTIRYLSFHLLILLIN